MKGFIEVHLSRKPRLINVYHIMDVFPTTMEGMARIKTSVDMSDHGNSYCVYCDESYDEIKQKIEEAQHD
jgi:hypothetical protein